MARLNGAQHDICGPIDRPADGSLVGVLAGIMGGAGARSGRPPERIRIDMRKLDRTRPFGKYAGQAFIPPGGDRVACYTQDGSDFDVNDREIVPGVTLAQAREQSRQTNQYRAEAAAALVAERDKLPPAVFKSASRLVLGAKKCPAKKADIVAALKEVVARSKAGASGEDDEADEDKKPAPASPETGKAINGHKGVSFQSMAGAKPAGAAPGARPQPTKPAPPPPPQAKKGANVDLVAWGRGDKDYAFTDVRTAIEERLAVSVTAPRAALEALIDKGLVPFEEARDDLLPKAEVEDFQDA
jgi:hypothetical protein